MSDTIILKRQNHINPDIDELYKMKKSLEGLIYSDLSPSDEKWKTAVEEIIRFQDVDGSFKLVDSYQIESDARVDFCHEPTYICTALLIKTLMAEKELLEGREQEILAPALHMCCARNLKGHGFEAFEGQLKAINYFVRCGVKDFLLQYPDFCPEFTKMFQALI